MDSFEKRSGIRFGKEERTMTYMNIIGSGLVVMMLFAAGAVYGGEPAGSDGDEETAVTQSFIEVKCDPCDYNLDYGSVSQPSEESRIDEGTVKLACDPCDYNIDYGDISVTEKE